MQGGSGSWPAVIRFRIFTSTKFLQEIINCSNDPPAWPSDADKVGSGDSEQIFLCPAQQSTLGGQLQRCNIENIHFDKGLKQEILIKLKLLIKVELSTEYIWCLKYFCLCYF